jgi:peroxiredoxin
MAATSSTMLPLGVAAPDFTLPDVVSGESVSLHDFAHKKALLVIFLCSHCPYVHHVQSELVRIAADYIDQGLGIVAITANDASQYPEDAPEPTARYAQAAGFTFPVCYDESQEVAKAYTAACTPDFFLFGPDRTLLYRGQIDDSRPMRGADRPGIGRLTGADLRSAIDAVLNGGTVPAQQRPSIGCSIKWKPGNEPNYQRS